MQAVSFCTFRRWETWRARSTDRQTEVKTLSEPGMHADSAGLYLWIGQILNRRAIVTNSVCSLVGGGTTRIDPFRVR